MRFKKRVRVRYGTWDGLNFSYFYKKSQEDFGEILTRFNKKVYLFNEKPPIFLF